MRRFLPGVLCLCCLSLPGQVLVLDRGIRPGAPRTGWRLAKMDGPGFIGDHFETGARGEVWIIDSVRVWAAADEGGGSGPLDDIFRSVALFGGIETAPPQPGTPPQPECDCHNLVAIKSGDLRAARLSPDTSDVRVSNVSNGVWQVDFRNLHWSVPGGVSLQFGVIGKGGNRTWYNQAGETGSLHELKSFDEKGALKGPYLLNGAPIDGGIGLNVQVWGHKMAPVAIRPGGSMMEVVLRSDTSFDATKTDATTLRFGPGKAVPVDHHTETVQEKPALVVRFRRVDTGIRNGVVNACLTGKQFDGVPFEGCDLVSK